MIRTLYKTNEITSMAKNLFIEERKIKRLDGWFLIKEIEKECDDKYNHFSLELKKAYLLKEVIEKIPLSFSENAIFVGTQRDAFAKSYALINPSFTVEGFSGYCDPIAIYNDIEPNDEFNEARINEVRKFAKESKMVSMLNKSYKEVENYTKEVIFFVEQVTGHLIPDFKQILKYGVNYLLNIAKQKDSDFYKALTISLECYKILIDRYIKIVKEKINDTNEAKLNYLIISLENIKENGASNLYEALQMYMLLWQIMCIEQAPNPYAFSVGNADRIFEEYRKDLTREEASELFKHFLVFFNVGDRSWAISQNILISGKDEEGRDLTNVMSYAILDAYYDMNLPQPILSVKLHKNTPKKLYEEMGKFMFSPGVLTPSFFNDDSIFEVLTKNGVKKEDLKNYSIAGCQEPLIMGKDNGNTTNSWLSLPKVLEMVLNNGYSLITNEKLMKVEDYSLENIRDVFYKTLEVVVKEMAKAANNASIALSYLRVPFLSAFMGGIESGYDLRDKDNQGTTYNGSGCLVHGLTVLGDSFVAIDEFIKKYNDKELLLKALRNNFEGYEEIREFLLNAPKFGNNIPVVDKEVREIALRVSNIIKNTKNYLGNKFRVDFSTPSTHLTYGYWVGATPEGRRSREMLGYGVDPLFGDAFNGLGFRILSNMKLPFEEFNGGYASHLGIDPKYFKGRTYEEKGIGFYNNIIQPLFFNALKDGVSPFYLYVNVTTPEILRKVLENPKKYAPSGIYIMRIHGTFVNFLDLSKEIQEDIIKRLDLKSTCLSC